MIKLRLSMMCVVTPMLLAGCIATQATPDITLAPWTQHPFGGEQISDKLSVYQVAETNPAYAAIAACGRQAYAAKRAALFERFHQPQSQLDYPAQLEAPLVFVKNELAVAYFWTADRMYAANFMVQCNKNNGRFEPQVIYAQEVFKGE